MEEIRFLLKEVTKNEAIYHPWELATPKDELKRRWNEILDWLYDHQSLTAGNIAFATFINLLLYGGRKGEGMNQNEYLRRNLFVAKAAGVEAGLTFAIRRLKSIKRPQQWLINLLVREQAKAEDVMLEIVRHRDEVQP